MHSQVNLSYALGKEHVILLQRQMQSPKVEINASGTDGFTTDGFTCGIC